MGKMCIPKRGEKLYTEEDLRILFGKDGGVAILEEVGNKLYNIIAYIKNPTTTEEYAEFIDFKNKVACSKYIISHYSELWDEATVGGLFLNG